MLAVVWAGAVALAALRGGGCGGACMHPHHRHVAVVGVRACGRGRVVARERWLERWRPAWSDAHPL